MAEVMKVNLDISRPTTKRFKLAFVCNPNLGGSGIIATQLALALADRGHEIHMLAESRPFSLESDHQNIYFHQIDVNDYPAFESSPFLLSLAGTLAQVVDHYQIDYLHAHYALPYGVAAVMAKQMTRHPVKIITTLHGTDIVCLSHDPALKSVMKMTLAQSDAVTCVSAELARQTSNFYGHSINPRVIPNFIADRQFTPLNKQHLRQAFNLKPDGFYLVHASNFRPIKRITDIIETLGLVRKDCDVQLVLLGTGPEMERCQHTVAALGLQSAVRFTGKTKQAWQWMAAADVNMQMSEYESFGLTLVEAMAQGTPTIATQTGGMPDVLADTGSLVNIGDIKAAADKIIHWCRNPDEIQRQRQRCIDRAHQHFTVDNVCKQYETLYHKHLDIAQKERRWQDSSEARSRIARDFIAYRHRL